MDFAANCANFSGGSVLILKIAVDFFEALFAEVCDIANLVSIVIRIAYEKPLFAEQLDVAVAVSDAEADLSTVGHNSPFQNSEFILNIEYLRDLGDHVVIKEAALNGFARVFIDVGKILYQRDLLFGRIEQGYVFFRIRVREEAARLKAFKARSVLTFYFHKISVRADDGVFVRYNISVSHFHILRSFKILFFFLAVDLVRHRLDLNELIIFALHRHQLLGRSAFYDAAVVNNNDLVRLAERGEAVSDHNGRSAAYQMLDSLLNEVLGLGVNGCRCLVENEDARIFEDRACDRKSLALSARKTDTALAENGIVSVGLARDKFVRVCDICGVNNIVNGICVVAVRNIVEDRVVEHHRLLLNESDLRTEIFHIDLADIDAVNVNMPLIVVIIAQEQIDERGFSRARSTDDTDDIARLDLQIDIFENLFGAVKGEGNILELDRAAHIDIRVSFSEIVLGLGIENIEDSLGRGEEVLVRIVEVCKEVNGLVEHRRIGDERNEKSGRDLTRDVGRAANGKSAEHPDNNGAH